MYQNFSLALAFCLIFFLLSCSAKSDDAELSSYNNSTIVFHDVNIIPMDSNRVLKNQTVIVRGDTIAEIGTAGSFDIPSGAYIIEGDDAYLMPGLTDFHIHLRSSSELISYLRYGVTSVVHMSGATSGAPDLFRYKKELESGEMLGPRLFTTGPILDGGPPIYSGVSTVVTSTDDARRVVAEQKKTGYDFIKVYNNLSPDVLNAVNETAEELGMAVLGHIPRKADRQEALQRVLSAGMDMIAHGEEYFFTYFYQDVDSLLDEGEIPYPDEGRIPSAVQMTKEAGTAVTPNLSFVAMTRRQLDDINSILNDPEAKFLDPEVLDMWREQNFTNRRDLERFDMREQAKYPFLQQLTKALSDAGVLLLLGTDASAPGLFPGKSAHIELQELVKGGLTPYEALATGTVNSYKFIHQYKPDIKPFGRIAVGQRADLILVEDNPLDNIENMLNILGVMKRGKYLTVKELEVKRQEAINLYSN